MKEALIPKNWKTYKGGENAIFLSTSLMSVFFPFITDTYNCIVNTYLLLNSLSKIGFFSKCNHTLKKNNLVFSYFYRL